MSNTDNMHYVKNPVSDAAIDLGLLPLSPADVVSKHITVCKAVQLYLAVWDDLTEGQRRLVSSHMQLCEQCAQEQQLLLSVTRSLTHLPGTQPSARVDHAVFAAIAARSHANTRIDGSIQKDQHFVPAFRDHTQTPPHAPLDPHTHSASAARHWWNYLCLKCCFQRVLSLRAMFMRRKTRP
jgi:hypothetical protein